ncbi:Zinc finger protein CONSTANS-LIKE 16, partial [Mucuna pruriens]
MTSTKNEVNAVGAKTARACDSCIRKRARWYCAADDAFLCQACDSSVHSANPLARRHHRVRLKIVSHNDCARAWHRGFTKKPRTPRHANNKHANKASSNPFDVVPEDTNSNEESVEPEQLLFRVPVCATPPSHEQATGVTEESLFLKSEIEIAEFAADVESLLGTGLESEFVGMEELGFVGNELEEGYASWECCVGGGNVKVEEEMKGREEAFELGFDCDDDEENVALTCEGLDESKVGEIHNNGGEFEENDEAKRKKILLLRLDYEAVITAWASQKSPWTTGDKPDLGTHLCWPHCTVPFMGACGVEFHYPYGELFGCHSAMADGGREARVSRYREKRRTRLFSKKIRYEVRKLNAEKRPRMKGRFVKRASFVAPPTFPLVNK